MSANATAQRTEFLAGMLVAAVEHGGYGWFTVREYENRVPAGTRAIIDDETDEGPWEIDLDTIAKGLAVIRNAEVDIVETSTRIDGSEYEVPGYVNARTRQRLYMGKEMRDRILAAERDPEDGAGQLDVVDALAVLECALFGAVTYA